ncbi:hypothetical protein BU23DRAFT_561828 [Bimuria novae-zelandiae CBS 107.79]|uniref:Uncharacterized protein n=1 Tax=Bimuria novae-zelandiae CBS 107.79 TaxID=1447943 RepID=A0A6A5UTY3_9PLEO|nr:hypothetical protein BU23DRAFT_561828 [Bimuria novae-zelandiae CBS 107.79]
MPPRQARGAKRAAKASKAPAKRARTGGCGTARQPIELDESQQLPPRTSPRKALANATSQATKERLFESQFKIYPHGYHVSPISDPSQIWFICKYCHQHKPAHLKERTKGHSHIKLGAAAKPLLLGG